MLSRLRLITFDVTDTLLKFRSSPGIQYGEIGAIYGIVGDHNELSVNFTNHWRRMNKEHPNYGFYSGLGWENWWRNLVKGTFKDSNFDADESQLDAIANHLINVYKTSTCWKHCNGASNLLSYIRSKGIPMGVISNFDPRLNQIMGNVKLRHYFQFIITSYEIGIEKPDKRIFEEAMKISGISKLQPNECLHIGDKPMLDYCGAINTGWNAAIISDGNKEKIKKYAVVKKDDWFESLYDIHRHFVVSSGDQLSSHSL